MTSNLRSFDGLGFFLYRSAAAPGLTEAGLSRILATARSRNQKLGLTGCLHYEDGMFFQWLEGPSTNLVKILDSITADDRHERVEILDQGPLEHRQFQDWRMRFSDRNSGSLTDWFARSDNSTVDRGHYNNGVVSFLLSLAT